jgi:hypothetical protein
MKYLFLGGCGRSGTSFVQKLFISNSKIEGGPEFDFLQPLLLTYKRMITPFHLERQEYFYDRESLDQYLRKFIGSALFNKHRDNNSIEFFSEKTPNNIDVAEELLTLFPDAFFVNIVRDGRDVLVSHLDVEKRFIKSGKPYNKQAFLLENVCALWNKSVNAYFKLIKNPLFKNRVINIKYEDLLQMPKEELSRICERIGVELEPNMLIPEKTKIEDGPLQVDNIWLTKEMMNAKFDTTKIGRWKGQLSFLQKRKADKIMQTNLKKFNYL